MYSRAGRILPTEIFIAFIDVGDNMQQLMLMLLFVLMARKPARGRRRYSLRKVNATPTITVGNLAVSTVVTGTVYGNADGAYRIMSFSGIWTLSDNTANDGPLVVGFAHADYTVTEIKECLESASSISIGNKVLNEQADRLVRVVGVFPGLSPDEALNDGRPIKTRLNWAIPIGTNLNIFAYNDDAGQRTTGGFVKLNGAGWVKDY